jgi:hypothetical protein
MGFLNHSTANIIIDAVLTEKGRALLARNDGSFQISSFSFADDEVDYTAITKYGNVTGKDKIEKNTPVMEAITNDKYAIKHNLISIAGNASDERILYMPNIVMTSPASTPLNLSTAVTQINQELTLTIKSRLSELSERVIPAAVQDTSFEIVYNKKFLRLLDSNGNIQGGTAFNDNSGNVYAGLRATSPANNLGVTELIFKLLPANISNETYTEFGSASDKTVIYTQITVSGIKSGRSLVIPVTINKNEI